MTAKWASDVTVGDHVLTGTGSATDGIGAQRTGHVTRIEEHPGAHVFGRLGDWRCFMYDTHNPAPHEPRDGHFWSRADSAVEIVEETP